MTSSSFEKTSPIREMSSCGENACSIRRVRAGEVPLVGVGGLEIWGWSSACPGTVSGTW